MLALIADLIAHPESQVEVEQILRGLVQTTAQEPGNLYYAVHRVEDVPNRFMVYELYRDQVACEQHLQSAPLQNALGQFATLLAGPPTLTFCAPLAATQFGI